MMKPRFESNLDFQLQVMDVVCNWLCNPRFYWTEPTTTREQIYPKHRFAFFWEGFCKNNRLTLFDDKSPESMSCLTGAMAGTFRVLEGSTP